MFEAQLKSSVRLVDNDVDNCQHLGILSMRTRHPKKDVEAALQYAETQGWIVIPKSAGHSWGTMNCPGGRGGCRVQPIWSTPKNPTNFARKLRRAVDKCTH